MHRVADHTRPETENLYNHNDCRIKHNPEDDSLFVERFDPAEENYIEIILPKSELDNLVKLIKLIPTEKNKDGSFVDDHLPGPGAVEFDAVMKVTRAVEQTPDSMKARIAELEAENAKLKAK